MNYIAYDFDGTIYDGDSMIDFYKFILRHRFRVVFYLPVQTLYILLWKLKLVNHTRMKEVFFSFLKSVRNIDIMVDNFWKEHDKKIKNFYFEREHQADIIISASPEFILQPIADKYRVRQLIASKVDKLSGRFLSNNCYGKEKATRLFEYDNNAVLDEFYTDSYHDKPLINIAKKSFMVNRNNITVINIL